MRPSSLGAGRILRRTLSVRLSVCLSVRPVIDTERHVAPPSELQWHTCTFGHALRAAYRTAISAAQILVYWQNLHCACAVSCCPIFDFLIPIFRIQYAASTELPLTIRAFPINSHAKLQHYSTQWKMVFRKKGKIWPSGKPSTETRFWVHWTKIHASEGKLWTRWMNQKKLRESTQRYMIRSWISTDTQNL